AVTSLLLLYPAADFWHFIMGLPAFLPLLAFQFQRTATPFRGIRGVVAGAVLLVVTFAFSGAFVDTLRYSLRVQPKPPSAVLARASGVAGASSKFADTVELVTYLDAQPKDVPMFALANQQMLYFLAGRTSAADPDEFILYLVASDVIDDADARNLLPPARPIERLQVSKP